MESIYWTLTYYFIHSNNLNITGLISGIEYSIKVLPHYYNGEFGANQTIKATTGE